VADDLALEVLKEIRDELREHGSILREHSTRFEQIDTRFAAVEGVLHDIAGQMVFVGRAFRSALDARDDGEERFEALEQRVSALEQRLPP
jgi:polyhydroxyalkanoate synthesis regulator phasin